MKQTYNVPDMHCPACSMLLEGIEDDLPGIRRISASYHKQRLEVDFDEAQVSETQIMAAAEELGYALTRQEK
jgi:copper chaperone CopZ